MKFIFIELERKFQQQKENLLYSTLSITMLCKYIQETFTNEVPTCCSILNLSASSFIKHCTYILIRIKNNYHQPKHFKKWLRKSLRMRITSAIHQIKIFIIYLLLSYYLVS